MRYTCANCDHVFETEEPKPRCPKCLRRHGILTLEEDEDPAAARAAARARDALVDHADDASSAVDRLARITSSGTSNYRWLLIGIAAVSLLGGGGIGLWYALRSSPPAAVPKDVPLGPVDANLLRKVAEKRAVTLTEIPFEITDKIAAAGRRIAQQAGGQPAQVVQALLAFVRQGVISTRSNASTPPPARPATTAAAAARPAPRRVASMTRPTATAAPPAAARPAAARPAAARPAAARPAAARPAAARPAATASKRPAPRRSASMTRPAAARPAATASKHPAASRGWIAIRPAGRLKTSHPLSATQLLDAIEQKRPTTVLGYELACLTLALARAAGLHAIMVEIHRYSHPKGPADPSGYVGTFGVAVYKGHGYAGTPAWVLDPAHGAVNTAAEFDTLTDLQAAAHALSLRAIYLLKARGELARANELSEAASKLAPHAATILAARGMLLLATGGLEPGLDAMRAARSAREDAARFYCLALAHLAHRDFGRALSNLDQAIGHDGHYPLAMTTKALVLLQQGKTSQASTLLDRAQAIAPHLPEALTARANLLLMRGQVDRALALLRLAVTQDPLAEEPRFHLWRVLYVSGKKAEAEAVAKKWLAMVPKPLRTRTRAQLDGFKKSFQAFKARQAPPSVPGTQGGGDPFKLQTPGTTSPGGGAGTPTTPFGKPPGNAPMLHL